MRRSPAAGSAQISPVSGRRDRTAAGRWGQAPSCGREAAVAAASRDRRAAAGRGEGQPRRRCRCVPRHRRHDAPPSRALAAPQRPLHRAAAQVSCAPLSIAGAVAAPASHDAHARCRRSRGSAKECAWRALRRPTVRIKLRRSAEAAAGSMLQRHAASPVGRVSGPHVDRRTASLADAGAGGVGTARGVEGRGRRRRTPRRHADAHGGPRAHTRHPATTPSPATCRTPCPTPRTSRPSPASPAPAPSRSARSAHTASRTASRASCALSLAPTAPGRLAD